jgi:hypothetical protein
LKAAVDLTAFVPERENHQLIGQWLMISKVAASSARLARKTGVSPLSALNAILEELDAKAERKTLSQADVLAAYDKADHIAGLHPDLMGVLVQRVAYWEAEGFPVVP